MTGLADVDGFNISVQMCVWPCFPPLVSSGQPCQHLTKAYVFLVNFTFILFQDDAERGATRRKPSSVKTRSFDLEMTLK